MAIESLPSLSVRTIGSLFRPPMPRIADCGWLMIGVPNCSPKMPGVGKREGAARDLIGLQLLAARALGHIGDGARDAEEVLLLRLLDDRNDQAPVERHRDADVDVLVVADGVAFHRRVDDRDACAAWRRPRA